MTETVLPSDPLLLPLVGVCVGDAVDGEGGGDGEE